MPDATLARLIMPTKIIPIEIATHLIALLLLKLLIYQHKTAININGKNLAPLIKSHIKKRRFGHRARIIHQHINTPQPLNEFPQRQCTFWQIAEIQLHNLRTDTVVNHLTSGFFCPCFIRVPGNANIKTLLRQ